MSNDIVLTGALRDSILNIGRIQRVVDETTLRLATGLKVTSALDDPNNFFTARALSNEARDLDRLVDGISQDIFAVDETNEGLTALTKLLQQAEALSSEALDVIKNTPTTGILTGTVDLSSVTDITTLAGVVAGQTFDITAGDGQGGSKTATVTIGANSGRALAARIDNLTSGGQKLDITAKLDENGRLYIQSTAGDFVHINARTGTADALTMQGIGLTYVDQFGNITAIADTELRSQKLFSVTTGNTARLTDRFRIGAIQPLIQGEDGRFFNRLRVDDALNTDFLILSANGDLVNTANIEFFGVEDAVLGQSRTIKQLIDAINANGFINPFFEADFDHDTGQIIFRKISDQAQALTMRLFESGGDNLETAFDFGSGALDSTFNNGTNTTADSFVFGSIPPEATARLEADLENIKAQIDQLVRDANYRGTNLLQGETLHTDFNPSRTSTLDIEGEDLSTAGLGLSNLNFDSEEGAEAAIESILDALEETRRFGTTLASDLAILQARLDFTRETVNMLKAGADDLTVADQNEEGANLIAMQTRQQLATTVLSFGNQSNQQILRLFG